MIRKILVAGLCVSAFAVAACQPAADDEADVVVETPAAPAPPAADASTTVVVPAPADGAAPAMPSDTPMAPEAPPATPPAK